LSSSVDVAFDELTEIIFGRTMENETQNPDVIPHGNTSFPTYTERKIGLKSINVLVVPEQKNYTSQRVIKKIMAHFKKYLQYLPSISVDILLLPVWKK
jgi:hypothetical protein